ncbi:hypothetical protein ACVWZL_007041 [Bradyrhizobium sp. GM2.4]
MTIETTSWPPPSYHVSGGGHLGIHGVGPPHRTRAIRTILF